MDECRGSGCIEAVYVKGLCSYHYYRKRKGESIDVTKAQARAERAGSWRVRIFSYIDADLADRESCWIWTGATSKGYGVLGTGANSVGKAHRLMWRLICGPIPPGYLVDHRRCHNRACVNPFHMLLVTDEINTVYNSLSVAARNARVTHCPQGHEYTPENTYVPPGRPNSRKCRECRKRHSADQARRARKRRATGTPSS